jgi:hypothetical protein
MSSEVKDPAEGNFRFSLGDFQNPVKISPKRNILKILKFENFENFHTHPF